MSKFNNPVSGFQYFIEGCKLITRPQIRRYVYIPFLINVVLFTLFWVLAIYWFRDLVGWFDQWLPSWLQWLNWILGILYGLACLVVIFYVSTFCANLIASPFNSLLAEKVAEFYGFLPPSSTGLLSFTKQIPVSIHRELAKLWFYLPRALGCLILFVIPGVQVIAPIIWLIFNAWTLAMEYFDYPIEVQQQSFAQLREAMNERRFLQLSFGSAVLIVMLVPFLNWIVMPAAVAGATKLWVEEYGRKNAGTQPPKIDVTIPS